VLSLRLSGIATVGVVGLLLTSCVPEEQVAIGIDSLTVATLGDVTEPQQAFLDRLDELSEGAIRVDMQENWTPSGGSGGSNEEALTAAVASGEIDIAWVTVRSLSAIGVTGIDSLEAPLLIQTPEQQREVATGLAGEIVMRQLKDTDIEGLSIFPGPLQYLVANDAPILDVADWAGKTVQFAPGGNEQSVVAETITTLGGTPTSDGQDPIADLLSGSVQVATANPTDLVSGGATATGPFMTGTFPLFPVMEMVIINRDVLDRLSTRQHGFIEGAVERAQTLSMAEPDRATPVNEACAAGLFFGIASADQFTALQTAVQPIQDALAADPKEAKLLEAIQDAVKRNTGSGALPVPSPCYWVAPAPPA
jgi:TRAP-type C4-dicarboxylate transport system substrate-binding protein